MDYEETLKWQVCLESQKNRRLLRASATYEAGGTGSQTVLSSENRKGE